VYEGEDGNDADADEQEEVLQADDGSSQNVENWGHSRFDLGTSDVDRDDGEDGDVAAADEVEDPSDPDDVSTQNVEDWGHCTREWKD